MEEDTKTEQSLNLNEDQLQTITGGTGGRVNTYFSVKDAANLDEKGLIKQHKREGDQAMSDAESLLIAGRKVKAVKSYKEATMHYNMITHISNNLAAGK